MPNPKDSLKVRFARYRQIKITVIGRKSGKTISIPVWFVLEGENLYLLPVRGSDTRWYRNVLKNPSIPVDLRQISAARFLLPCLAPFRLQNKRDKIRREIDAIPFLGTTSVQLRREKNRFAAP